MSSIILPSLIGFLGGLGPQEMIVFGIIAIILFGKRLPEVAGSLGRSYQQFRRGLGDIQKQMDIGGYVNDAVNSAKYASTSGSSTQSAPTFDDTDDDYDQPTAPKFEPPTDA